ncbi:MAG: DUF481 domain-containing protein, partial [Acidobacteriota bacterium]
LDFDSDEFDDQSLDWDDIQEIRSAGVFQVRFLDNSVVTGKILLQDGKLRLIGGEASEHDASQVLSITANQERRRDLWGGDIGAGFNFRSGNTEQTEANASLSLIRRTPESRINIDYLGNFSESDSTTIADNQRTSANWDRFISDRFFWTPLYGEIFRDPFQNIAARWTAGVGLGYTVVDTAKVDWDIKGGLAYQGTTFDDVLPDVDDSETSPTLSLGTTYEHELTGWLDYHFNYDLYIVSEDAGTYTHHLITGFEFDLPSDFDFNIDWVWDYIKDPRQKSDGEYPENSDYRMIFSLGYSF